MVHIEGEIVINRPIEAVFDFVADACNEPRYNPLILRAEKTSPSAADPQVDRKNRRSSAVAALDASMAVSRAFSRSRFPNMYINSFYGWEKSAMR